MHNERDDLSLPQAGQSRRYLDEIEIVGSWQDFDIVLIDDTTLDEPILEQAIKRQTDVDAFDYTPLEFGPIDRNCKCRSCRYYHHHGIKSPYL